MSNDIVGGFSQFMSLAVRRQTQRQQQAKEELDAQKKHAIDALFAEQMVHWNAAMGEDVLNAMVSEGFVWAPVHQPTNQTDYERRKRLDGSAYLRVRDPVSERAIDVQWIPAEAGDGGHFAIRLTIAPLPSSHLGSRSEPEVLKEVFSPDLPEKFALCVYRTRELDEQEKAWVQKNREAAEAEAQEKKQREQREQELQARRRLLRELHDRAASLEHTIAARLLREQRERLAAGLWKWPTVNGVPVPIELYKLKFTSAASRDQDGEDIFEHKEFWALEPAPVGGRWITLQGGKIVPMIVKEPPTLMVEVHTFDAADKLPFGLYVDEYRWIEGFLNSDGEYVRDEAQKAFEQIGKTPVAPIRDRIDLMLRPGYSPEPAAAESDEAEEMKPDLAAELLAQLASGLLRNADGTARKIEPGELLTNRDLYQATEDLLLDNQQELDAGGLLDDVVNAYKTIRGWLQMESFDNPLYCDDGDTDSSGEPGL